MSVESRVRDELDGLRSSLAGVDGCVVATSDGLLVAHTYDGEEKSQIAALIATLVGLARHAVHVNGRGSLLEAAVRGTSGYRAVYAVGEGAVLAVLGRSDLNIALLQHKTRPVVARLAELAGGFTGFATFAAAPEPVR